MYLYRHIRLDKNEPFYIGIGSEKFGFNRAISRKRNNYWRNIVNKTPYDVEIMLVGLSLDEAIEKEKEFIQIYKRKCDGGTLTNISLGGEGRIGVCGPMHHNYGKSLTYEQKVKISISRSGIQPWNTGKKRVFKERPTMKGRLVLEKNPSAIPVVNVRTGQEFGCMKLAWLWATENNLFNLQYPTFRGQISGRLPNNKTGFVLKKNG